MMLLGCDGGKRYDFFFCDFSVLIRTVKVFVGSGIFHVRVHPPFLRLSC